MYITRIINGVKVCIELTPSELSAACDEQLLRYDIADIRYRLNQLINPEMKNGQDVEIAGVKVTACEIRKALQDEDILTKISWNYQHIRQNNAKLERQEWRCAEEAIRNTLVAARNAEQGNKSTSTEFAA